MNTVPRTYAEGVPDEIDIVTILGYIWRRRVLVVIITLVCVAFGVAAGFVMPPVYESTITLRPVAVNQLDALNQSRIYSLPPEEALRKVGAGLGSYDARLAFFRSKPELIKAFKGEGQSVEQAFQDFNDSAMGTVQADTKNDNAFTKFISLDMRYGKTIDGSKVLNDFVDFVIERERLQLSNDMHVILANRVAEVDSKLASALSEYRSANIARIAKLEEADAIERAKLTDELKALRVELKDQRLSRLAQIDEAISIARSLGLKRPSTPSLMSNETSGGSNIIRNEVNDRPMPLYFMGTDVLEAERAALRSRTTDDFVAPRIGEIRKRLVELSTNRNVEAIKNRVDDQAFIEGVEALRGERARLLAIDTKLDGLRLVSIDQRAIPAKAPIKPRKLMLVLISLIAGLLIGICMAVARGVFRDRVTGVRRPGYTTIQPGLPDEPLARGGVLLPDTVT